MLVSLHLSLFIYIFVASFCSVNFIDIVQQTHQLMKSEKIAFSLSFFCLLLSFNFSSLQQQLFSGHQQQQSSIKLLHKSMLNCCHLSSHLKSIWRQFFLIFQSWVILFDLRSFRKGFSWKFRFLINNEINQLENFSVILKKK